MGKSLVKNVLDTQNKKRKLSLFAIRYSLFAIRIPIPIYLIPIYLIPIFLIASATLNAQVIIKEKVEINPQQNILPEYPQSVSDPCLRIISPYSYQSVYSCVAYPIEPAQQLYPMQVTFGGSSPYYYALDSATIYDVRITSGTEYAYLFKATYWDTVLQIPVEPEYLGSEIIGITGWELCGWGDFIGFIGSGLWEREHQSDYRIVYNNYSAMEAWVNFEITNHTTGEIKTWHTKIVNPTFVFKNLLYDGDTLNHHIGMQPKNGMFIDRYIENTLEEECLLQTGCPPDNLRFSISLVSGAQYGQIIKQDPYTEFNEYSDEFTDLSYDDIMYYNFFFTPDGLQPDSTETVVIRTASNDSDLGYKDNTIYVKRNFLPAVSDGGSIVIGTNKNTALPGDTLDILLKWNDEPDGIVDFNDWQEFAVWLADGFSYGTLLNPVTGDTSDTFSTIGKEIKLIVHQNITDINKKIIIAAETEVALLGGNRMLQNNPPNTIDMKSSDKKIFNNRRLEQNGFVKEKDKTKNEDTVDDEINIDIALGSRYLSGVKEITVNPFIVEFDPPTVSAGDTARIIPKYMDENGNYIEYTESQTFELGILDGCMLGKLSNEGIDTNYFYGVTQPFYFITDSSADSGIVNIRVGVIDINPQNRSVTNNNSNIENDNPIEYCFLNLYQTELYVDANVVVGNECEDYPCDENFKYTPPDIVSEIDDIVWSTTYTYENATRDFCPEGSPKGGHTRILFDDAFDVPFNSRKLIKDQLITPYTLDACFDNVKNKWQYSFMTNGDINKIELRTLVSMCDWGEPTDINDIAGLNNIPEEDVCLALKDFEKHRPYPFLGEQIPVPEKYNIKDAFINHEKAHVMFFQLDIKKALKRKYKYYGVVKSFKDHLKFTPYCTEIFQNKSSAIYQGKKYYEGLIKEFVKQLHSIYSKRIEDYYMDENRTQWNDYVQNTITYYQKKLKKKWPLVDCDYDMSEEWKIYEQYINKF